MKQTVIKQLFGESGNQCAFHGCTTPVIDPASHFVICEICHIHARNRGGPRFDPTLSADEVNGYDNLIILCPTHHRIIDEDVDSYPPDILRSMKESHARAVSHEDKVSDSVLAALTAKFNSEIEASVHITSINQSGGQIAHTINNLGQPERHLTENVRRKMLTILQSEHRGKVGFASTQGDVEAHSFKAKLMQVFQEARWDVIDMHTFMFFGEKSGLVVTIPFKASENGAPQVVAHALAQTGEDIQGNRGDMANDCRIYVQVWHAKR